MARESRIGNFILLTVNIGLFMLIGVQGFQTAPHFLFSDPLTPIPSTEALCQGLEIEVHAPSTLHCC